MGNVSCFFGEVFGGGEGQALHSLPLLKKVKLVFILKGKFQRKEYNSFGK